MRFIETDTGTNVDISAAVAIGAYTADADRLIIVDVMIDAVAGDGDYEMYVTKQIGGSGSAYKILPKTTMTAASGETAISGQSGLIAVRSGDVLTVYVDGLAGDTTTPDYTTRWFELAALKPTTFDRTLDVTATGAAGIDWSNIENKTATVDLTATTTNDDTTTWAYASRTLTQSAASVTDVVSGSSITAHRGDTLSAALTNIGALTNYSKIWFTVKRDYEDADSAAIIQIEKTGGLLYFNGAVAATAANGSITIDDEPTGDVTIALVAARTAELNPGNYVYDIQILRSAGTAVSTLTYGDFIVESDVTKATT